MKISIDTLRWMNHHYVSTGEIMSNGIDELVEKIGAQLGAVEEVIDLGKTYQDIVIAQVVSCQKHPNADKLSLCLIDDGGIVKKVDRNRDGYVQVVCGAPNVREGLLVAWLPPGATVPSSVGKDPFILEARELRGEISNGMLASGSELALSDDHGGILEITEDFKPGDDFAKVYGLDGHVIDIENKMFTHRPDCFGFLGVARELAGIQQMPFKSPKWYIEKPMFPKPETTELKLKVQNNVPKLVPRLTAIAMRNVQVGPSPTWLQVELAKVGSRSINNIVDYTNFFMLESGQPLHAYDADKLPAQSLETRMSKTGEKLKMLNGKIVTFVDDSTVLITSGDKPVGIGGVMGGSDTEVDANTKNIVLECANFDMYSIRRTSMKYGLFTDAVTRFNKGPSPLQNLAVLAKIVKEIQKSAGGKVASAVHDDNHAVSKRKAVRVGIKFVNERLGLDLMADDMQKLLENVEFEIERTDNKDELKVTPPFWRTDIEIPEDIVEEVGRLYGYDHLPLVLPKRDLTPAKHDDLLAFKQKLREVLSKAGANEVLTYSFVHGNLLDKVGQDRRLAFELSNALSPDLQFYRTGLTPSLLDKVHMNIKAGFDKFALFELNKVHYKGEWDPEDPKVPLEDNHLALVIAYDEKQQPTGAPYYHARKYLEQIAGDLVQDLQPLDGFDLKKDEWGKQLTAPYEPTRSAIIVKEGEIWGVIGEFKTSVKRSLKLPDYTSGFEVNIGVLSQEASAYKPLPRFPKVQQDISLKVSADLPFAELFDFVQNNLAAPENTQSTLTPIDIYQGSDKKHKNITLRLTIASYKKTMTDAEVNSMLDNVAVKAKSKLGAQRI